MLYISCATLLLSLTAPINRHILILIGFSLFASFSLHKFSVSAFNSPFTFTTTCLTSFLDIANGHRLPFFIFFCSLFLSLPRFPLPVPPQRITFSSIKTVTYITLSILLSSASIVVGLRSRALSIVSDAIMGICNEVGLFGTVVADVAFLLPVSARFSFGLKRVRVVCSFAVTVLLCFISATLVVESVESLLIPSEDAEARDPLVVVLAMASFAVNTTAAIYFGAVDLRSCGIRTEGAAMSILSDLISSAAVVITSWIRLKWGIEWLDPFVSLLISAMIFLITVREMAPLVGILLQKAPLGVSVSEIARRMRGEEGGGEARGNIWMIDEQKGVGTVALANVDYRKKEEVIEWIMENVGEVEWTVEVGVT